jgi:hypothetical protein
MLLQFMQLPYESASQSYSIPSLQTSSDFLIMGKSFTHTDILFWNLPGNVQTT